MRPRHQPNEFKLLQATRARAEQARNDLDSERLTAVTGFERGKWRNKTAKLDILRGGDEDKKGRTRCSRETSSRDAYAVLLHSELRRCLISNAACAMSSVSAAVAGISESWYILVMRSSGSSSLLLLR